jgi:hypothetical protein
MFDAMELPTTDVDITDVIDAGAGFYLWLKDFRLEPKLAGQFPGIYDRFEEARYFLESLVTLKPCDACRDAANWFLGAHLSAFIGIDDAARHDFTSLGREYTNTPLSNEFWLRSNDPDPSVRDPLAVNNLCRDLRNLRVHFAEKLVEVRNRILLSDITRGRDPGLPRWYLRQLDALNLSRLKSQRLSEFEIHKLNKFLDHKPLVSFLSQNMMVMARTINESLG